MHWIKLHIQILLYGIVSCFILSGCQNQSKEQKKIFRYNESTGIATLDPAFAKNQSIIWAVHQLYNTLVETNDRLQITPSLAKSWEISTDRTVYTFHLRTDVFFHDNEAFPVGKGRKLIASDIVYSFNRIIDPATASSGAWIFNGKIDPLKAFRALNDSIFQLTLLHPFNPILGVLSMQYCSVVPHEVVEKFGKDFRRHPCGTGPFIFKDWEEGMALTMIKNSNYWEKDSNGISLPYLDAIKVSFLDSKASEFLNFRQKKLDFINDIDPSFKDEIITKKGELKKEWKSKVQLQKHSYLNIEYLGFLIDTTNLLVKSSPLKLKKIRQAINYAIDKRKMIFYLRNNIGYAAENGFSPMGLASFDTSVKGYNYQPQKAAQLLEDAGFSHGINLPVIKLITVPAYADFASYIANELIKIGISLQVEIIQKSLLLEQTAKSQALFFRGSWIADYPDAENYFAVFYSKNPAPPNYTRYKDKKFDELYEQALRESNDSIRYILYHEMDRKIIEDAPIVPLWYDMIIRLVQPNIKGFMPNSLNLLELRKVNK